MCIESMVCNMGVRTYVCMDYTYAYMHILYVMHLYAITGLSANVSMSMESNLPKVDARFVDNVYEWRRLCSLLFACLPSSCNRITLKDLSVFDHDSHPPSKVVCVCVRACVRTCVRVFCMYFAYVCVFVNSVLASMQK